MNTLELWLVSYLANALWMVPLVFAAAWAAAGLTRRLGPRPVHRIWVAALLTEVLLPGMHLRIFSHDILRFFGISEITPAHERTAITVGAMAGRKPGELVLSHTVLLAIAILYAGALTYFAMRFGYRLWKTHAIALRSNTLCEEAVGNRWRTIAAAFDIDAAIAESAEIAGPVTVGIRRAVLLLPLGFAERTAQQDLDAVMAHECAHMARHDFLKNVFYNLLSLPCAFHPFLWLTRTQVSESREMICDATAAEMLDGPRTYARSLLRLASAIAERPQVNIHAIGIFDANHLERRLMTLTTQKAPSAGALRAATFVVCAVIGLATFASALTLRTEIGTRADGSTENGKSPAKDAAHLSMPVLISSKAPEYPAKGKESHLSGICLVGLKVDEQGMPQDVHILRSLRPDFDQNAMEAVREYRFKPALADGKPVARQLTVEVKFAYF